VSCLSSCLGVTGKVGVREEGDVEAGDESWLSFEYWYSSSSRVVAVEAEPEDPG